MVPDKFNMVDMGGIDLIMMQGEEVPGLYNRLVESIAQCRYQCLYNWLFDGVIIPPTYVELEVNEDDEVEINEGVVVTPDDVIHIYSIERPVEPVTIPLLAEENGTYNVPEGVDGFQPVAVDVPSYTPVIQSLSITENGTYTAPSGVDGYSPVTVNVSTEVKSAKLSVGASNAVVNAVDEYISGVANDSYFIPRNSNNNYAKLDLSSPFEICCKFKLTQNTGQYARLAFGSQNDWYYSPAVGIRPNNAGFCFNFAKQGSSGWQYDQYNFTPSGYSGVPLDTWITVKVTFDGTDTVFYATDGTVEATYTVSNSAPRYASNYVFEFGGQNRSQYSICSVGSVIDLDGTYLKQGNTVIWGYEM